MSFYCIKNISVKRVTLQEYEKTKAMQIQREDYTQSESLAAVYFNPENILKRMNFRPALASNNREPAGAGEEPADANTPTPPGARLGEGPSRSREARRSPTESEETL
jgi:hypothetical protein